MLVTRNVGDRVGAAMLVVLHDLNLVPGSADRVAVLSRGRLAAYGTAWEVCSQGLLSEVFKHPVVVVRHPMRDRPLVMPTSDF